MKRFKIIYFALTFSLLVCGQHAGAAGTSGASTGSIPSGYFQVKISNRTNLSGTPIYLLIKASTLNGNQQCLMSFDQNGLGSCNVVTQNDSLSAYETVTLNGLPQDGNGNTVIYLPQAGSGRMYFSIGQPLNLYYDPNSKLVTDPDGFNPRDVNYYTLYDKVEFSYTGNGVWINPTAVDFFSIPISLTDNNSLTVQNAGLNGSRQSIFNDVQNAFNVYDKTATREWSKLLLTYAGSSGNTANLRIASPGKAMVTNLSGTNPFDVNYLSGYIKNLWAFYSAPNNVLRIDCSELQGVLKLSGYIFSGSVDSRNKFIFTNGNPSENVIIEQPQDSVPFFGGAGGTFNAANNTPNAIIIRELTSAFEAGLLPPPDGALLNQAFFKTNSGSFYNNNASIPGGPWYDLYSKALHSYGALQPIYTFAYDDAMGQDGTIYDANSASPSATITLHDMSGTAIPNPYSDPNSYTVTLNIPDTSTVIYNGARLQNNSVETVSSPFHITFNGQETDIYINPTIIRPNSPLLAGVVVAQNSASKSAYTISFPAPGPAQVPIVPLTAPMSATTTANPSSTVNPGTTTNPAPAANPNPAPAAVSYTVTPRIGSGSVITTVSGYQLTHLTSFTTASPFVVYVNGQMATIDLQSGQASGPGATGVKLSGASQPGGSVYIDFPANSGSAPAAPAPSANPAPATPVPTPAPATGGYSVTPRIGVGSVVTTASGSQLTHLTSFTTASPFVVYVNGQMATIDLQSGQASGPGATGVTVAGASQPGGSVYIDFPAYNGNTPATPPSANPAPAPAAPTSNPAPATGSYSVTPRIGVGSVVTTASGSRLTHLTSFTTASPFVVYVNGQMATIDLQSGQVGGPGSTGIVVSGSSSTGGIYIDFPAK